MEWIDKKNPSASPLLTKPKDPHGPNRVVIFDENNSEQYRELVDWVNRVVLDQKGQVASQPATVKRQSGSHLKGNFPKPAGVQHASHNATRPNYQSIPSDLKHTNRAGFKTPLPTQKSGNQNNAVPKIDTETATQGTKAGTKKKPKQPSPVDPFDPAIFNRRYLPEE
jgi:hypothetical protein